METPTDAPTPPSPPPMSTTAIKVTPHPAETPLKVILTIIGIILWIGLIVSVIGFVYALAIGLILFIAHTGLIVHLRGNAVKLGPQQLPGLYKRVVTLSQRMGLKKIPDAYLVQSGGVLNAFATKYGSRNFIALYSDIVRSCGDNMNALDFVIGHELGHLHRGHLRWRFLKAPATFIPFLSSAYYRSCEYTCDQYGKQACGDHSKCLDGLCLLAGGARYAMSINRKEFVAQTNDLNTSLMKLGTWFAAHPPLVKRAGALDPTLKPKYQNEAVATIGALVLAALLTIAPIGVGVYVVTDFITKAKTAMHKAPPMMQQGSPNFVMPSPPPAPPPPHSFGQ